MPTVPKVAVITRTKDRPLLLRRAIQSVLQQTFPDWTHIIVNDGGAVDPLDEVCKEFKEAYDGRLTLLHEAPQGMQAASNTAIRKSDSTYIVIHDDDDSWNPDFLQAAVDFLEEKGPDDGYQGVITKSMRILESEETDGTFAEKERRPYIPLKEISLIRVGYENPFPPISFLFRRSAFEQIGFYNPRWDMIADLDFNFRFLQHFEIGVIDRTLAFYHWRDSSGGGANTNSVTLQKERHSLLLNELKNDYLRKATTANEAAVALGFQFSTFAVENQWMTTEIREHSLEANIHLKNILGEIEVLHGFNNSALWPKVTEDVIPRLQNLQQATAQLEELKVLVGSIQAFGQNEIWPKLTDDVMSKLNGLISMVESFSGQCIKLLNNLESGPLQGILQSVHHEAIRLQTFNNEHLWPKLEEFSNAAGQQWTKLEELSHQLDQQWPKLEEFSNAAGQQWTKLEHLSNQLDQQWPKLEAMCLSLSHISATASSIWERGHENHSMLGELKEEVKALREQSTRQCQVGRLRLQWLPKGDRSQSEKQP